jgi:2-hydroxychromene-2-carboxylate isomerase
MRSLDWYFDFLSTYCYLQFLELDRLPADVEVRYRPILFAAVLNHFGNKGPGEIESKRRFVFRQLLWTSRQQGIALRFPPHHPFNPLPPLRLAVALGATRAAVGEIFRFIWTEGRDVDAPDDWQALLARLGVTAEGARLSSPRTKQALKDNTDEAIARGVFGVPASVVAGELFWGHDSMAMLLDFLQRPTVFDDAELRRVADLPYGAARR